MLINNRMKNMLGYSHKIEEIDIHACNYVDDYWGQND